MGDAISRKVFVFFIVSVMSLLFIYSNCSPYAKFDESSLTAFSSQSALNWPNESTSLLYSDKMASPVAYADLNKDGEDEAVFVSTSEEGKFFVIRVIGSDTGKELLNYSDLSVLPDAQTKMIVVQFADVSSIKHLVYLSQSRDRLVALSLNSASTTPAFEVSLKNAIGFVDEVNFVQRKVSNYIDLQIGNNQILVPDGDFTKLQVRSLLEPQDGGWGEFSDWYKFKNGTLCSKLCGDGMRLRSRLCNDPVPLAGGKFCQAEDLSAQFGAGNESVLSVVSQACNRRACVEEDCGEFEYLVDGNCMRDPNAPDPYEGVGGSGGLSTGGSSGSGGSGGSSVVVKGPQDCGGNQVYDPLTYACYRAYQYSDIWLEYQEPSFFVRVREGEEKPEPVIHRYRLTVNHPQAIGVSIENTAMQYCLGQGHFTAITWETQTYVAGSGGSSNAFVLCNIATNGRYKKCPLGGVHPGIRYDYKDITFTNGSTVQYLKKVVCRKKDGEDPQGTTSNQTTQSAQ